MRPDVAESLLRAALDSTADGILVVDVGGAVTTFNRQFARMWGIPPEVLATRDDEQLLGFVLGQLADADAFLAKVRELYAQPHATSLDDVRLRSGRVFERLSQPQLLHDQPIGRVWSFRDVTEARRASELRSALESRLLSVFEHAGVGVAENDLDGRFLSANRTLCQMLGYSLDELRSMRFQDVTHPDDVPANLETLRDAVAGGRSSYQFEKRYVRRDGGTLWAQLSVGIVRDPAGQPLRLVPVIRDITEQRRAEAALARSERRLAEAQRIAQTGSWRFNLKTLTVESSAMHHEIYGLPPSPDTVPLAVFTQALLPDERPRVTEVFASAIRDRRPFTVGSKIRRADGEVRDVELRVYFATGEADTVEMFGTTQDVTERRSLEERLVVSDRMASLGSLAAGVAHEINNPLASLLGNLTLVSEDLAALGLPTAVAETLRDIADAAERIRIIARDLRVFARADEDSAATVVLEPVLESSLRLVANELRHRAVVVRDYGPVPPVMANASRLGQVFLNLLINAAHAVGDGAADRHRVTVRTRTDERGWAVIEVSDTGVGIPPAQLGSLFQPFRTTKPAGQGTGLGLAICERIVTALGGTIAVDSRVGHGATFRVALPPVAPVVATPAAPAPVASGAPTVGTPRARVLVVDDERLVGDVVRRALAAHDVTALQNAQDALVAIRKGARFDVILCDVMMPVLSGIEFFRALEADAPDQAGRLIFMTGGAFTPGAQEFLASSRRPQLEKPLNLKSLRAVVADTAHAP